MPISFTKLSTPALAPADSGEIAWSPDGIYLAQTGGGISSSPAPYVDWYKRTDDTFTKLASPASPGFAPEGLKWSPDGTHLAVCGYNNSGGPYVSIYKRSGDTLTKLTTGIPTTPTPADACAYSPNGTYFAVSYRRDSTLNPNGPYLRIYKRNGDIYTLLTSIPASTVTGTAKEMDWLPNGSHLVISHSPYASGINFTVLKQVGDTFEMIARPSVMPDRSAGDLCISPDGKYVIITLANDEGAEPSFGIMYKHSGDTYTHIPWTVSQDDIDPDYDPVNYEGIEMQDTGLLIKGRYLLRTGWDYTAQIGTAVLYLISDSGTELVMPRGTLGLPASKSISSCALTYDDKYLAVNGVIGGVSSAPYLDIYKIADLPPNPPSGLSPASETKLNNEVIRFSWTHNATQIDDTQSKFDLQWSSNGGSTWNTVSQTTSNQYYDMPANTLPVGSIIWKVRTYATSGIVSEYSEQAAFTSAGKPTTPVLTKPDAIENTSTPLIAWTGTGQVMYQAQVLQGETVVWDSGEIASTTEQAQVGTALADETSYTAKVRIKNQYDLWSDWATKAFAVDFELPNKPTIDIIKDLIRYSARITISNPTPDSAGGFAYNEVYRREIGGAWIRIATNIPRDSTYEDCAMKSGQPYEYKVRAVGTFGYMDSDVKFSDAKVKDSQLASLTDKSLYVPLRYDPQRTISISMERVLMKFAGRPQAVTEFGEHIDRGISLRFVIESLENVEKLIQLAESAETLLYRDGKGRKIYCTIGNLSIEELENYWTVSFAIAETSHQEAV